MFLLLDDRYIYLVVLAVAANQSDEHQSLAVSHKHNQPVVVAFDVEHDTLVGNERGISVSCFDIRRGLPPCTASQGIPSLKRGLGVRALFPSELCPTNQLSQSSDTTAQLILPNRASLLPLIIQLRIVSLPIIIGAC